jgi:hypothetical protein
MGFMEAVTGIVCDPYTNTTRPVADNIGVHGDVFNKDRSVFKRRHSPFGTEDSLADVEDTDIRAGHYQKLRAITQGFALSVGFVRETDGGVPPSYPEGGMIQTGAVVSAIAPNDITVFYERVDGTRLLGPEGKIHLPTILPEQSWKPAAKR